MPLLIRLNLPFMFKKTKIEIKQEIQCFLMSNGHNSMTNQNIDSVLNRINTLRLSSKTILRTTT